MIAAIVAPAGIRNIHAGQRPQYDVFVSREIEAGKNFYTKIGSAWNVAKDGISITLDATPVDGRMVLFPVKERDD
jgi:hypothetical protein